MTKGNDEGWTTKEEGKMVGSRGFLRGKGFLLLLLILLGGAAVLMTVARARTAPTAAAPAVVSRVQVVTVSLEPLIRRTLSATATLEAPQSVVLIPKESGKLVALKVGPGDPVRRGQVVALLDHRDQDAQVGALSAQIAVSRAELEQARAELESAKRERDRYRRLLKEGFATRQELDTRQTTLDSAEANFDRASASIGQAQANLQARQVTRSEFVLKAPIDGVVMRDYDLAPGALLGTSTSVLEIARIDTLKAVLSLPESQLPRVRSGMKGLLTGEGFPGRDVEGSVRRVDPYVDSSTRTAKVEVAVPNRALGYPLKPGMFAKVELVEASARDALTVPADCVRNGAVFVVKDGVARRVPVKVGLVLTDRVQVLSGLASGDQVVLSGGDTLKDRDRVSTD
jgi:membrane fusion protein (multidrug efflux system)